MCKSCVTPLGGASRTTASANSCDDSFRKCNTHLVSVQCRRQALSHPPHGTRFCSRPITSPAGRGTPIRCTGRGREGARRVSSGKGGFNCVLRVCRQHEFAMRGASSARTRQPPLCSRGMASLAAPGLTRLAADVPQGVARGEQRCGRLEGVEGCCGVAAGEAVNCLASCHATARKVVCGLSPECHRRSEPAAKNAQQIKR